MTTLRGWWVTLVSAVVTAALLLVGVVLFLGGNDDSGTQATSAASASRPRSPAKPGPQMGAEGVPLSGGAALGAVHSPRPGSAHGGIPCGSTEQLTYHVHARLTVFVNGKPRSVPAGIGIGAPLRVTQNAHGPFVSGGSCFSFLHTHAADGVIHIEAPGEVDFSLGQFFGVWQQRLDRRHLGAFSGPVVAYVNGKRYHGDPRTIMLAKHAQITLELGRPRVTPPSITFPAGL